MIYEYDFVRVYIIIEILDRLEFYIDVDYHKNVDKIPNYRDLVLTYEI